MLSLSQHEAHRARRTISWFDKLTMRFADSTMIQKRLTLSLSKGEARQTL